MKKLKEKNINRLLSFYQDSIADHLSRKYQKKLEKKEHLLFQQAFLKAAKQIKYDHIEKFRIPNWSMILCLSDLPQFNPQSSFGQMFGEKDWIKDLVIKIFNIANYEKMIGNDKKYYLIFFRHPGHELINLISVQEFFKHIVINKIKFFNAEGVIKLAQKIKKQSEQATTIYQINAFEN